MKFPVMCSPETKIYLNDQAKIEDYCTYCSMRLFILIAKDRKNEPSLGVEVNDLDIK